MCNNRVLYHVPRGHDFRQFTVKCGNTDPFGGRAICEECLEDKDTMSAIERIERQIAYDNNASRSAGWGDW